VTSRKKAQKDAGTIIFGAAFYHEGTLFFKVCFSGGRV
jgi:hypothetical protein